MKKTITNITDVKKINIKNTFDYIYHHSQCTKQNIAQSINLSLPTISNCITELLNDNLIVYNGSANSTGGRKAQYISVNSSFKTSIGISISPNHLRIVALDLLGNVKCFSKVKYTYVSYSELAKTLSEQLEIFIDERDIDRSTIIGVNIAISGLISFDGTTITIAPTLKIKNLPTKEITKYIPYVSKVSNDASCGGFAELWNTTDENDLIYFSVDRGVGGAIFFNKQQFNGDNNFSAEFGHICIKPDGKQCDCGKKGCLEAYCSTNVISKDLNCTLEFFFEQVSNNNEKYISILTEYIKNLAIGITNTYVIFDKPIIIGGSLSPYSHLFVNILNNEINKRTPFHSDRKVYGFSKYGSNSSCIGAGLFYIQNYINTI